jgi:DNA repair protein RadC
MNKLPREKLIEDGIDKLTDDELLAIMLGVGTKNEDVFTMSKRLIKDYGFSHLLRMD